MTRSGGYVVGGLLAAAISAAATFNRAGRALAAGAAAWRAFLFRAGFGTAVGAGQQLFAGDFVAFVERGPPLAQFGVNLARGAAQQQEVIAGAEARMLQQLVRRLAVAALEARLHRPDVAHVGADLALQRQFFGLRIEHVVGREMQRRDGLFAGGAIGGPLLQNLVPQQRREQESRRDGLAGGDDRK